MNFSTYDFLSRLSLESSNIMLKLLSASIRLSMFQIFLAYTNPCSIILFSVLVFNRYLW